MYCSLCLFKPYKNLFILIHVHLFFFICYFGYFYAINHTPVHVLFDQWYISTCPVWSIIYQYMSCLINDTPVHVLFDQWYISTCPVWSIIYQYMSCLINDTSVHVLFDQSYISTCPVWSIIHQYMSCLSRLNKNVDRICF